MNKSASKARTNIPDLVFKIITGASAISIIVVMVAIAYVLLSKSLPSINEFGLKFLWDKSWNPVLMKFGAASSIYGTLVSTIIAMLLAAPMGLIIALFLVELSHPVIARIVGSALELLAAIPSIIYGMWGLFILVPIMQGQVQPWLQSVFGPLPIFNTLFSGHPMGIGMLTAGIILALMILPFITAVSRDVLEMVPPVLKEAGHGMGATMWEVMRNVSIPYGIRGIVGAMFLGLGRAIGETMAVTFVIGNSHDISASLFSSSNTIASTIALEFGEALGDPMFTSVLIELGLILFLITFVFQVIAQLWINKLKKHERS
ncbi:MAG TPA: phosphate ABC transporter permease subunit PstC [Firmicutes bacterium]|nr:phosphate ABC transporter permease subunit PstC [Bacillota bacterium]